MNNQNLVNMDLTELNVSEKNMSKDDIHKSVNNIMDIIFNILLDDYYSNNS